MRWFPWVVGGVIGCVSGAACAQSDQWELAGYAALEHRQFVNGSPLASQSDKRVQPSAVLEPELYYEGDENTYTARLFLRLDGMDSERTHADIRQLDWVHAQDDWELRAGVSKVFWGVTESRHLVDVINQTDDVEDVDGEDKLGQPMVQLATFQSWGNVRFYYLPYFRERTFAGRDGRLRGPVPVNADRARYSSGAKQWHPDVAVRYQHSVGAWDIGLAQFHGTSREPTLRLDASGELIPFYEVIDQTSVDAQYTTGAWLWKLEAMMRAGQGDRFGAVTGGFEYTFYGVADSDADVGVLMEYHRDGRDWRAPSTLFDNDVFIGSRVTLNDIDDTMFLGGAVVDLHDASQSYLLEASTRLSNHVKLEVDARFFAQTDRDQPTYVMRQDDHVQVRLSYYF